MCGICGRFSYIDNRPAHIEELKNMCAVINHRGPDDEGFYVNGSIGFGPKRLSIIDLSGGHQPMSNEDKSICIVYNGEVYNYIEIREDLLKKGHKFTTSSDTEVIVHAYEEYGEECVYQFNGMFAFAIWDEKKQTLFLARDRTGIKPLYYTLLNGSLLFASEIKSLLQCGGVHAEVNMKAIGSFLTFGYVPDEETMFRGINKLLPGHTLTIRNGSLTIKQYWNLNFHVNRRNSERDFIEALNEILSRSIEIRLRSDVPIGVFLSGGVDSSTVVGMLSSMIDEPMKTFSISYKSQNCDESDYARLIARRFNTEHYEMVMSPEMFRDFIPGFTWYMDEPTTEASALSLYYVSKLASEHIKVILSGEGSDELFAGYPVYRYMKMLELFRKIPHFLKRWAASTADFFNLPKAYRYSFLSSLPLEERYLGVNLYNIVTRQKLYSQGFKEQIRDFDPLEPIRILYESTKNEDILNRMLYVDIKTWLPNYILIKSDRMSMGTSIELRVPFLDHDLIDFVATMPPKLKLKGSATKYILKKAVGDILPREIIYRKKMGFPAPLASMFRHDLKEYVNEILLDSRTENRGYFDYSVVRSIIKDHQAGRTDNHRVIWQLIVLEEWHRCFIDGY